jgi:hypothetical protein
MQRAGQTKSKQERAPVNSFADAGNLFLFTVPRGKKRKRDSKEQNRAQKPAPAKHQPKHSGKNIAQPSGGAENRQQGDNGQQKKHYHYNRPFCVRGNLKNRKLFFFGTVSFSSDISAPGHDFVID